MFKCQLVACLIVLYLKGPRGQLRPGYTGCGQSYPSYPPNYPRPPVQPYYNYTGILYTYSYPQPRAPPSPSLCPPSYPSYPVYPPTSSHPPVSPVSYNPPRSLPPPPPPPPVYGSPCSPVRFPPPTPGPRPHYRNPCNYPNYNSIYGHRSSANPYGPYGAQPNYYPMTQTPYRPQTAPGYGRPPPSTGHGYLYYRPMYVLNNNFGYSYPSGYTGPSSPNYGNPYPYLGTIIYGYPTYGYPQSYNPNGFQRRGALEAPKSNPKEPMFMGRGSAQVVNGRDAELTCSFNNPAYTIVSNAAWVKVTGPYDHYLPVPPFECKAPGCNYVYLNGANDFRYRVITMGQMTVLRIYDYNPADSGVYRCASTGVDKADGKTVTLYQVVELMPAPNPMMG